MTEEIERMITQLTAFCNSESSSVPTTRPPAAAATTVYPKLLLKTETMQAHSEYSGPDWRYLLVMPGDVIVVYAYINDATAVGFNTRTNLGGRFTVEIAKKMDPQPDVKPEIFLCTGSRSQSKGFGGPTYLAYERGDYVRVCKWEKEGRSAYAFNQGTLLFGKGFVDDWKKIEWHDEN
jgi:hypothetical protein